MKHKHKNIILIVTDTFRYDNLFDYASDMPVSTPCLDKFINERASSVDCFFSGSFPTIPHRTDLATGKLGWPHYPWQPIANSSPNRIAKIFANSDAEYVTQLICDCPHLFKMGFQNDFIAAFQHRGQEADMYFLHLNDPIPHVVPLEKTRRSNFFKGTVLPDQYRWINRYPVCEEESFCWKTSVTTMRWLEENYKAGPFFLWVDFFDPHEPWDPPEYMVRKYDPDYQGIPMIHCNYGPASDYTREELKNLRAHYAAESELVDRAIGRIIRKLDDIGLWKDTILVITADHGTSLGEHARTGKSNIHPTDKRYWPLYPEITHIPFILAGGDIPKGKRFDFIAQPVDILPTLAAFAGCKINPPEPFDGKSFADIILNGENKEFRQYAVSGCFANLSESDSYPYKVVTPFITTKQWGYAPVGTNGDIELFDLENDPIAENNIASHYPHVVKEMHNMFIRHLEEYNAPCETINFFKQIIKLD